MRRQLLTILALVLAACTSAPASVPLAPGATPLPDSAAPAIQPTTPPSPLPTAAATSVREAAPPPATRRPSDGPLALAPARLPLGSCDQPSPLALLNQGVIQLAFVPTGVCSNGEIGLIEPGDRLYVVQAGLGAAAFSITDVTDPAAPSLIGVWQWRPGGITYDIKPFRQAERWYLALGLENQRLAARGPCGIAIVEVTEPRAPRLLGRYDGTAVGSEIAWCNIHTTQIDVDARGDATYLLAASRDTFDLRVLDIRDLRNIREVNLYHLHAHPHGAYPDFQGSFVHDTTIVGERVYVAYWTAGVMILDRRWLEAGAAPEAFVLNGPESIAPLDFNAHHSYPTPDGDFLFVEAEDRISGGLRLFDIRDLARPREALTIELDGAQSAPHNLLVAGDLLFVGWYSEGVRVFRYAVGDPERPVVEPVAFQEVRADQSSPYDGVWGVRVHPCQIKGSATICIYASDIQLGLIILALAAVSD